MMKAKDTSVSGLTKGIEFLFKKNNVEYIKGTGAFQDEHTVAVNLVEGGETTIRGKNILIATGSEATPFPGLTIDEQKVITSTGAIALQEVPKKMTVIGGGIIGLEMVGEQARVSKVMLTIDRPLSGRVSALKSPLLSFWVRLVAPAWTTRSPNRPRRSLQSRA
jgi:dihydrolipoamide dehydrogenase